MRGKNDLLDAHNAARAALSGLATAIPKTADGITEMLRQVKVAKNTAVKARTTAMITLKALLVNVEPELRELLQGRSKMALIDRDAGLRSGRLDTPLAAPKHALRALARRWRHQNPFATFSKTRALVALGRTPPTTPTPHPTSTPRLCHRTRTQRTYSPCRLKATPSPLPTPATSRPTVANAENDSRSTL